VGGDSAEGLEIWSVEDKQMVHYIECPFDNSFVSCSYSANGMLAVGFSHDGGNRLYLYEASSWTNIYHHEFQTCPRYLFLTPDNKYLAAGFSDSFADFDKCIILEIR